MFFPVNQQIQIFMALSWLKSSKWHDVFVWFSEAFHDFHKGMCSVDRRFQSVSPDESGLPAILAAKGHSDSSLAQYSAHSRRDRYKNLKGGWSEFRR